MTGLLLFLRRVMRRQPRSTTVTVTRVVGTPGEDEEQVPDVVVVETQEPVQDTGALKLVRLTLTVSVVTLGVLVVYVAYRTVRPKIQFYMKE